MSGTANQKVLVIGADSFAGSYLVRYLLENTNYAITGTNSTEGSTHECGIQLLHLADQSMGSFQRLLHETQPDLIFNMAAVNSISRAWEEPDLMIDTHVIGVLNLLDAVRQLTPQSAVLLIGSGDEYGRVDYSALPVSEETVTAPENIFAASKVCQNIMAQIYARAYKLRIVCARSFNEVGPGQLDCFVISNLCKQAVMIEKSLQAPVLETGNVNISRDFTDIRDSVRAFVALAEKGKAGEIYNVGSGRCTNIFDIVELIRKNTSAKFEVEADSDRFRPIDISAVYADIEKITSAVSYQPVIPLERTIRDVLDYWRANMGI